jgi:alkylation response protein AidB-like acyl-CoA dehydrogenase
MSDQAGDVGVAGGGANFQEREEFAQAVRHFVESHADIGRTRAIIDNNTDFDRDVWRRIVSEFSATSLHLPTAFGGEGFGFGEFCVLLTETGRELVPSPLWSSAGFATSLLLELGPDPRAAELLSSLAGHQQRATVAVVEPGGSWDPASVRAQLSGAGTDARLTAVKTLVPDAYADVLLVLVRQSGAEANEGVTVAAVDPDDPGVTIVPLPSLDVTRPIYEVRFEDASAPAVGSSPHVAPDALERAFARATIALAAEMVGGARRCVERAVSYACLREQFGTPIGSFQAIKHLCANMLVECELAEAVVRAGVDVLDASNIEQAQLIALASIAKLHASRAYLYCALENLHVHGSIGFTWEHDAHLYVRRAKACELLLGGQSYHRRILARHLGLGGLNV